MDDLVLEDYEIVYNLWDVSIHFNCPRCQRHWETPTMNYLINPGIFDKPMNFRCSCDNDYKTVSFKNLNMRISLLYNHYRRL